MYTDEKLIEEISDGTVSPVRSGGSSSAGAHADAVPHDADQFDIVARAAAILR